MGNGRRLKEELGDRVKIVAAEPMQSEPVQGLRSLDDGFVPPAGGLGTRDPCERNRPGVRQRDVGALSAPMAVRPWLGRAAGREGRRWQAWRRS
jgi:hypothetical protein